MGKSNLRYKSIERTLRRRKNQKHPKKPTSIKDIIEAFKNQSIMNDYALNLSRTERFYINTIEHELYSFTLFASYQIMSLIENMPYRNYSVDGTFDMTPVNSFYQLLTIHIEYEKSVSSNLK